MKYYWDNPTYPFRIFKSHYAPPVLPVRKKGGKKIKYLAMTRNGIDVAASMNLFYSSFTQEFRNMWGGWPGDAVKGADPPQAVKDLLPGGPIESFHFGYAKGWWPYRNDPNVLLLHYTDARKDLKGHVAKIAKFLEVDLNEKELETVTKRCSLEHMKKVDKFNYQMPLNKEKGVFAVNDGAMTRKGGVGIGEEICSLATMLDIEKNLDLFLSCAYTNR